MKPVGGTRLVLGLAALTLVAVAAGVFLGPASLTPGEVLAALAGRGGPGGAIVWVLRLPRVVLGLLVGGVLAVSGASLQVLVRNPLADPYLLGLSGGAGLGAVLALTAGVSTPWLVPAAAFAGAVATMGMVYALASAAGGVLDGRVLLLAGVVVGAFAGALVTGILAVSAAQHARTALVWLMGGLGGVGWPAILALGCYAVPGLLVLAAEARTLNLLAMGDETARHLGADVERSRRRVYLAASLLTAAAVAAAGIIGFVGLVVPHAIRMLRGHDNRALLPASFVAGGALLVLADAGARTAFAPLELPVGVVTAVVGVPVFAILLRRWTARSSS
jgi:iron complex transport system permease protein